ncbi:hypothetical protein GCM10010307_54160 [Streptomyces vastus]|uniref:Uncharacterized protein n=1 Tax=Streptomyces vastus TaxID=285451 RepID=A0ABN3RA49_9ACTN
MTAASALGRSAGSVDKPYLSQSAPNKRASATRSASDSGQEKEGREKEGRDKEGRDKELHALRAPRSDPARGSDTTLTRGWRCPPLESSCEGA